jgi:hypothetical protein
MEILCSVRRIVQHFIVSSGTVVDQFLDILLWDWTKLAFKTMEKAMESYMVELISEYHFRSSNKFPVDFQHASNNGKTRRLGTA